MKVYALGDPHLSFARPKPMDIFGAQWENHAARLADAWRRTVGGDDLVLVAGDISWAMKLEEAKADLDWLAALPGRKALIRGNHDYWWTSPKKMRAAAPSLNFIQNNVYRCGTVAVAGTRLWDFPECGWGHPPVPGASTGPEERPNRHDEELDPEKLRARELERLRLSLSQLPRDDGITRICMTHYPPVGADGASTALTRMMAGYGVTWCVYGHIHGWPGALPAGADTTVDGIHCRLVSLDAVGFAPCRLMELPLVGGLTDGVSGKSAP